MPKIDARVADAFGEAKGGLLAELGAVEGGPAETSEMVERLGPCSVVVEHPEVEPGRLGRRVPQIHTGREVNPDPVRGHNDRRLDATASSRSRS